MQDLAVYLRLTPEFGGARFGPFEGLEVRLGSDGERCHIVIPEALGVLGEHVKVIRQDANNLVVTPADRTAAVFLWKAGERRPAPVHTPTAVRPGDAFALVTPEGPRFIVELDELPPEVKAQRDEASKRRGTGRSRLTADSMAAEVKRQAWTRILVLGPAQLAQRAVTFVRSGAIFQPRNIILGLTMIAGFAFGGFQSCKVGKLNKQLGTQQVRIEECDEELGLAKQMGADSAEMNFKQLASRITTSSKLGTALEADKELQKLVKKEAAAMMAEPASFDWLVKGKGGPQARAFNQWRGRVFKSEVFDNDTRLLMTWLVSRPEQTQEEWTMGVDSMGVDTCLRGPMRLTFRQSKNLGFASRLDGWAPGGSASVETPDARKELLSRTATSAGMALPDPIEMEVTASDQGAGVCVHELGDDGRKEVRDLLKQLEAALGPNAEGLPGPENNSAAVARVAAYWAADMPEVRYDTQKKEWEGLKLDTKVISKRLEDKETRGMWALKHTARTIAQAVVVPCLAVLNGDKERMESIFGDQEYPVPNGVSCLVLNWQLLHGEG